MKASETNFLKFLQGTKQFVTPIYQRRYTWTKKTCQQLLEDIEQAAVNPKIAGHFIGSIVYIENSLYHISSVTQLSVIDGQQRIATLMLILLALGKQMEASEQEQEMTLKKIMTYYLVNGEEKGEQYFRFQLSKSDRNTMNALLTGNKLPAQYSKRLVDNYEFIVDYVKQSEIRPSDYFKGISKLFMVDIALNIEHDDPQLIFESLNSTGIDLTQADLIRNLLLMNMTDTERNKLYHDYWYPIEEIFFQYEDINVFDKFMRDYITVKTGKIPNINAIYTSFKSYYKGNFTVEEIMKELYRYADYYLKIVYQKEQDRELRQCFVDIKALNVEVSYPVLLKLYDDYINDLLSKNDLIQIIDTIEAYIFRRSVCEIPTNTLSKTFLFLQRELHQSEHLDIVRAVLLTRDSYRRFPDDDEFKQALMSKDIYNFRNRNYLLNKLENHNRKEVVDTSQLTVEHIMPQNENLSQSWKRMLGNQWEETQDKYLHTLGNLTLTAYNSELSDRPFEEKKNIQGGFKDSPLKLNRILASLPEWNADQIERRALVLAEQAIQIWQYVDEVSTELYAKYIQNKELLPINQNIEEQFPFLKGRLLLVYEQLREHIVGLSSEVREEVKKQYIAYKLDTNFVDIEPQKKCLRLSINMLFKEVYDPNGICKDISNTSRWGNGEVEVKLSKLEEIDEVMDVVRQAMD